MAKRRRLALFLSSGAGLWTWRQVGSLTRELALYRKLSDLGWHTTFYGYDRRRDLPALELDADVRSQWPWLLPHRLSFVYQALSSLLRGPPPGGADIVMTNQAHSGWGACIAARRWRAPLVARCGYVLGEREHLAEGRPGPLMRARLYSERWTMACAARCLVPTQRLASWVQDGYGIEATKIEVMPNYVETDRLRPLDVEPTAAGRRRFDVLSIGRLIEKKRHELLIEALAGTGLRVCIAGVGPRRDALLGLARARGVELELAGRVEHADLPALLALAPVYVILSRWEGHPKALLEAMACARACVGARAPGVRDVLHHGQDGLLVDAAPAAVRTAVLELLADAPLRARLGSAARAAVVERCDIERVAARYAELFEELSRDTVS